MATSENLQICIKKLNDWPSKSSPRSRSTIFSILPFDGICQNLQMSPSHFYASSYSMREINIGQSHGGEKRHLRPSIASVWMCIDNFFIILSARQYTNERISHILNIWYRKYRSRSRRRKKDLQRSIADVIMCNADLFFMILTLQQHTKTNEFHIFLKFEIEICSHGVKFLQWRHSMANVKIHKRHFLQFLIFAKVGN